MGCGCGGKSAASAQANETWVIKFTDGTQDTRTFPNKAEAEMALARTGKTGLARKAA